MASRTTVSRSLRAAGLGVLTCLLALTGCGEGSGPVAEVSVSREVFIATYVDLRAAALAAPDDTLEPTERAAILDRHGVNERELLAFAETHGDDPEYMAAVWDEVQERMNRRTPEEEADTPAAEEEPPDPGSGVTPRSSSPG